jgi:methionine synthase II (cobalamin-independent)
VPDCGMAFCRRDIIKRRQEQMAREEAERAKMAAAEEEMRR